MTSEQFIRNFLLQIDVLGVYHPDNENEDEYDAYIKMTEYAFTSRIHAKTYAKELVFELTICEDGNRWTGVDHKIPSIIEAFKQAKKAYKKLF